MFAASPLFNGNEDFRDVVNKDGTPLFSQSTDNSKWEREAKAAKLVIDMPEYDLYKEYLDDGSIDALMSCINPVSYTHLDVYKRQSRNGIVL